MCGVKYVWVRKYHRKYGFKWEKQASYKLFWGKCGKGYKSFHKY